MSKRAVHEAVKRADVLEGAPAFAGALAVEDVSPAHVDAYGRAAAHSPVLADHADELAVAASRLSPAEFTEHCKRVALVNEAEDDANERFRRQQGAARLKRWVDESTGMYKLYGEFDPETGEKMWTALNRQIEAMFHDSHPATAPKDPLARQDHLAALALAHLVLHGESAPGTGTRRAEVLVVIDSRRCCAGCTRRRSSTSRTVARCRRRWCGAWRARPASSRWSSVATAWCSTWVARDGWPRPTNAGLCS